METILSKKTIKLTEIDEQNLASRAEIREMSAAGFTQGKQIFHIPLSYMAVRAGFNHRVDFGDISLLADGILASGTTEPLSVDVLKDGTAVITDGERRYLAYIELNKRKAVGFDKIPVLINDRKMSEILRKLLQYNANNVKRFTDLEEAEYFKDLHLNDRLSVSDIARSLGVSKMQVSDRLRLAGISDEEKELITNKEVSTTAVMGLMKSGLDADERVRRIKQAASTGERLKVKDAVAKKDDIEQTIKEMEAPPLEPNSGPENIVAECLIHIKAIDKITTDHNILDITFKVDQRLRELKRMLSKNYIKRGEGDDDKDSPF